VAAEAERTAFQRLKDEALVIAHDVADVAEHARTQVVDKAVEAEAVLKSAGHNAMHGIWADSPAGKAAAQASTEVHGAGIGVGEAPATSTDVGDGTSDQSGAGADQSGSTLP
jgi:hypothetical protein